MAGRIVFGQRPGLPLATYFSGLKIRWILENVPGARELARSGRFAFRQCRFLSGVEITGGAQRRNSCYRRDECEPHAADGSRDSRWDQEILAAFGIPEKILPKIASSSEIYGKAQLDSISDVPIAGILGDQQAALVGQTCFAPGEAKNTYGTGCFLLVNTGDEAGAFQLRIAYYCRLQIRR